MKRVAISLIAALGIGVAAPAHADVERPMPSAAPDHHGDHWDYTHQDDWPVQCLIAGRQSPVALATFDTLEPDGAPLFPDGSADGRFSYGPVPLPPERTSHGLQITTPPDLRYGYAFSWRGSRDHPGGEAEYLLRQFHFHVPAEHRIAPSDGKGSETIGFAMEVHLVHDRTDGEGRSVVAILFREGDENPFLAKLIDSMAGGVGHEVDLRGLLPAEPTRIFVYQGSLTAPPCSEGVIWLVAENPMTASAEQIAALRGFVGFDNARHVVPRRAEGIRIPPMRLHGR